MSSGQLNRFNQSVIDPKYLLKIAAKSFSFDNYLHTYGYLVRFTYFPKWLRIIINTKFLKVLRFGVFIQICQQVSLSLKLENVTFCLICLVF